MSLDDLEPDLRTNPAATEADELLAEIHSLLNSDQSQLLELLLENATQREIAEQRRVDERTIRQRIKAMQCILNGQLASIDKQNVMLPDSTVETINLPNINYRQFVLGKLVARSHQSRLSGIS